MICRSFTPNRGYWRPLQGDHDFAEILSQDTIDRIDTDINNTRTGNATIEGTMYGSFGIDTDDECARLHTTELTASRDFTFPDKDATLVGVGVSQTWSASQVFGKLTHAKSTASLDGKVLIGSTLHVKSTASIDGKASITGKTIVASTIHGKAVASIDGKLKVNGDADFNDNVITGIEGGNSVHARHFVINTSDLTANAASQDINLYRASSGDVIYDVVGNIGTPFGTITLASSDHNASKFNIMVGDAGDVDGFGAKQHLGSNVVSAGWMYDGQGREKGAYLYNPASTLRHSKVYTEATLIKARVLASICNLASIEQGAVHIYITTLQNE
jgi:hypothetical protein